MEALHPLERDDVVPVHEVQTIPHQPEGYSMMTPSPLENQIQPIIVATNPTYEQPMQYAHVNNIETVNMTYNNGMSQNVPIVTSEFDLRQVQKDRDQALKILLLFYLGFLFPPLWILGWQMGQERGEHSRRLGEWSCNFFRSFLCCSCCAVIVIFIGALFYFAQAKAK
jgi:hypothetical protein